MHVAPSTEHRKVLSEIDCDFIIDVGANLLACQLVKPGVPTVAFEPIPAEAEVFRRVISGFESVQLY